jgi:putative transposase
MPFDANRHHRHSIRWKGYDYTSVGLYFVTICIEGRMPLLGEITDGQMVLHPAEEMVQRVWNEIPAHYPGVDVDAFVVMPNHIHGIIVLTPNGGQAREHGRVQGPLPPTNSVP